MYDVTNKESFYGLEAWHQTLLNNADSRIIVMLLANKCDLPDKQVSFEEGSELAKSKGWGFLEVSAKSDINIKSAFTGLVKQIHNSTVSSGQSLASRADMPSISLHEKREPAKKDKKKGCC